VFKFINIYIYISINGLKNILKLFSSLTFFIIIMSYNRESLFKLCNYISDCSNIKFYNANKGYGFIPILVVIFVIRCL
jgi:hypothetical protein